MKDVRALLITGASSGIGAALARCYAAPGTTLVLGGRDRARLEATADACRESGAEVHASIIDVRDATLMTAWVREADARRPLDLVIANAGISGGTGGGDAAARTREIFATNVDGVLNTVLPAIEGMRERRRGQIGIMSSLAAFRGLPGAAAYSASKAAVKAWGEGLRGWLAGEGIEVSVVCPGFVESRITAANRFAMPLLMDADRAAAIIRRGLEADRSRIAFPRRLYAAAWLLGALPVNLTDRLVRALPEKR